MEYAAVIIPTLNRCKHLKRCVDSLLSNKEACLTDLYISVDYPPSEKYRNGYSDVTEYVKTISGFASVNVFFQEYNLGPGLNRRFLEEKISGAHDKYVFTDDDNEFSSNFLSYINWGLEYYKEDESVYAICSCTDFDIIKPTVHADYFMVTAYNPYGAGHWLHKNKKCSDYLCQESVNLTYRDKGRQQMLLKHSPMIYMCIAQDSLRRISAMRGRDDSFTYIDIWENYYIIENSKKCVKPLVPKSRNWGLDGSGVHANAGESADYIPDISLDLLSRWNENPVRMDQETEELNEESHRKKFAITKNEEIKCNWLFKLNKLLGNQALYGAYAAMKKIYGMIKKKDNCSETVIKYG